MDRILISEDEFDSCFNDSTCLHITAEFQDADDWTIKLVQVFLPGKKLKFITEIPLHIFSEVELNH